MVKVFRFGVVSAGNASSSAWITLAQRVEELGYASLLMPDRTITPLAALTALAVAATVTTTLRVGSYVFANDYRHPVLLAREVATLDQLCNGRFELGLGAGVGASDFQQLGMPLTRMALASLALRRRCLSLRRSIPTKSSISPARGLCSGGCPAERQVITGNGGRGKIA